ncbi:MAG: hypothetical protein CMG74_04765 [Candidatus Marinimicrobia bacterium]|nr:hypothetical protein [Candidatus Neomarinimicrobiota bacterium]|tara:strand:+ start:5284 stop:5967 length:684 start_codon:yes stop_codon:yes gene_type:complete
MTTLAEYDSKRVLKPWGSEYVVYRDKKKISITLLNITKNKTTSFHCHPSKKTGFILLSGKAIVRLGLEKRDKIKFKAISKLMIRPGLFHSIRSLSKNFIALEFETPSNKRDLVRLYDNYGRKNKPYENQKKNLKKLSINELKFEKPKYNISKKYIIGSNSIFLENHFNFSKTNKRPNDEIYAVLEGNVIDKKRNKVLSVGDIVRNETLKKLSKSFKINSKIIFLRVI